MEGFYRKKVGTGELSVKEKKGLFWRHLLRGGKVFILKIALPLLSLWGWRGPMWHIDDFAPGAWPENSRLVKVN